jgi:hypothetical protein
MNTGFWGGNVWGKKSLGKPRRRWDDNIKKDIHEI